MQPNLNEIDSKRESEETYSDIEPPNRENGQGVKLYSFYIAESINLKILKADFTGKLLSSSSSELFYSVGDNSYIYIFNYGAVVFANFSTIEMSKTINFLRTYCSMFFDKKLDEKYEIITQKEGGTVFTFNSLFVPKITENVIKIAMMNLAHSVSLDYYTDVSEEILTSIKNFSIELETKGKLYISKNNMLKFIGKSLNAKNRIAENLYIFDAPEIVWEDEYIDKINKGLIDSFELRNRHKEIEFTFKNIEDNLYMFLEINQHSESNRLEYIIIILIFIEVINMFFSKIH
ncbi:MAG: RMD1 family protein [Desulfamplus sp.]|nr:RMD1 family protein [Desulfamplus sp.]